MWFQKLLETIDLRLFGKANEELLATLASTNPNRIRIENIKSILKIPYSQAKIYCEMAVKDGNLVKKTGLICPNADCERTIVSFENGSKINEEEIVCEPCELNGHERFTFKQSELQREVFYQIP